jgi:hypothetical protein
MVIDFAARVKGVQLPYEHKGITLDDYAKHYEGNENQTIEIAIDYFKTNLFEISMHKSIAGDVLIATHQKLIEHIFFCINGGNGKLVTVMIDGGTQVANQEHFNIVKVFTWAR